MKRAIKKGASSEELADRYWPQWVRYNRSFEKYMEFKRPIQGRKPIVTLYWGPPGAGKSVRAEYEAGPTAYWLPPGDWFPGYTGQAFVILDDFKASCMTLHMLQRILDRFPLKVPIKGGHVEWCPEQIWITSNTHPRDWYKAPHAEASILRRIDYIYYMEGPTAEPEEPPYVPPPIQYCKHNLQRPHGICSVFCKQSENNFTTTSVADVD